MVQYIALIKKLTSESVNFQTQVCFLNYPRPGKYANASSNQFSGHSHENSQIFTMFLSYSRDNFQMKDICRVDFNFINYQTGICKALVFPGTFLEI